MILEDDGKHSTTIQYDEHSRPTLYIDENGRILRKIDYDVVSTALSERSDCPAFGMHKGAVAGEKIAVLNRQVGCEEYLYRVYQYDKYGNQITECGKNHLGGRVANSNTYDPLSQDITGEVKGITYDSDNADDEHSFARGYVYENAGRLKSMDFGMTFGANMGLSGNELTNKYDALGRLQTKSIGGLQNVDYKYNIRGWLTDINDIKQCSAATVVMPNNVSEMESNDDFLNSKSCIKQPHWSLADLDNLSTQFIEDEHTRKNFHQVLRLLY